MADILHKLAIEAPPEKVYEMIATKAGLSKWWTPKVTHEPRLGAEASFEFPGTGISGMVTEVHPNTKISWKFSKAENHWMDEWVGTELSISVERDERGNAVLRLAHAGWKKPNDYYMTCNYTWAYLLTGLKNLLEGRKANPIT